MAEANIDIWPHVLQQDLVDPDDGTEQKQVLVVSSIPAAIAHGAIDGNELEESAQKTMLLVVAESGEQSAVQLIDKEEFLRWTVELLQRLVHEIGYARAREIVRAVQEQKDESVPGLIDVSKLPQA